MNTYTINFEPICKATDEIFAQLCRRNPEIKFERNNQGEIIIMSPTGGETGNCNFNLAVKFGLWNEQTGLGVCFDSSTCFKLPNGSLRSPDLAWIKQERWQQLTPEERETFPPITPDFVLELMSPSDSLKDVQTKMNEYLENGVKLGWLINRNKRQVEIYRQGKAVEILNSPQFLFGEDILLDFILDLSIVWR